MSASRICAGAALVATLSAAPAVLRAQTSGPDTIVRIVVLNLVAKGEAVAIAEELSELVINTARESLAGIEVTGQSELATLLTVEQQKMAVGCESDTSCLAEIGGALGADHMITGRLGKIGGTYLLSMKLIYAPRAMVVRQFSERAQDDPEKLIELVTRGVGSLVNPDRGFLRVAVSGVVFVDGEEMGGAPGKFAVAPGDHEVVLKDPAGAEVFSQRVRVVAQQEILVGPGVSQAVKEVAAVEEDSPWYKSWILWTVVGGVVVAGAGAGTAAYFATQGGSGSTTPGLVTVDINDFY